MRKFTGMAIVGIAVVFIAFFAVSFGGSVLSQNSGGDIACDSDLVLLWYVADRFFNFGAVQAAAAQTADPATVLDLNRFNPGEFAALFNGLRNIQDPNTRLLPNAALDPNFLSIAAATLQMDDTAFNDLLASMQPANTDAAALLDLVPVSVANQAPECALLRSQLHRFFAAVAFQDVQSGEGAALGLILNNNPNANTNVNANDNGNANVNANGNTNVNDNTGDNANTNTNVNDNTGDNGNTNVNDNNDDNGNDNGNGGGNGNDNNDDGDGDNSGSGNGGDNGGGEDGDNSGSGGGDH